MTRLVITGICLSIIAVAALRKRRPAFDPTDAAGDYGFIGFDGPEPKERTIPIVNVTGATIRLRVAAPNGGN